VDEITVRLLFESQVVPYPNVMKVDWKSDDPECAWSSLYYEPTSDELIAGRWSFDKQTMVSLFAGFLAGCVPEGGRAYARIAFSHNKPALHDLSRFSSNIAKFSEGKWTKPDSYYMELTRDRIYDMFGTYDDWLISPWLFLVSRNPAGEWVSELESINRFWLAKKDTLRQFEMLLLNDYEHGLDVMSCKLASKALQEIAKMVAGRIGLPLELKNAC